MGEEINLQVDALIFGARVWFRALVLPTLSGFLFGNGECHGSVQVVDCRLCY